MMPSVKHERNCLHIGLAFDENYFVPAFVSITSILKQDSDKKIFFHIIASGIDEKGESEVTAYIKVNGSDCKFYKVDASELSQKIVLPTNSHFSVAAYYRLLFPILVDASIRKLLYIDTDAVVIRSVYDLYQTNLGHFPLAAVLDPYPAIRTDLNIFEEGKYFNSGVLLIDLENWKTQNISQKCFDFVKAKPEAMVFVDQDALNAVLIDNWMPLERKYNVMSIDAKLQTPKRKLLKENVIIHYTSPWKPWHCLTKNKLRSVYHHYLKLSPKKSEKKYVDFNWQPKTLLSFLRIRCKEKYFDWQLNKVIPIKSWQNVKYNNY